MPHLGHRGWGRNTASNPLIRTFFHILESSEVVSGLKGSLPKNPSRQLSLISFYLLHFPSSLLYGLNRTGSLCPKGCNWSLNKDAFRSPCPGTEFRKSCFVFQEINPVPTGRNYPCCSKDIGGGGGRGEKRGNPQQSQGFDISWPSCLNHILLL